MQQKNTKKEKHEMEILRKFRHTAEGLRDVNMGPLQVPISQDVDPRRLDFLIRRRYNSTAPALPMIDMFNTTNHVHDHDAARVSGAARAAPDLDLGSSSGGSVGAAPVSSTISKSVAEKVTFSTERNASDPKATTPTNEPAETRPSRQRYCKRGETSAEKLSAFPSATHENTLVPLWFFP